MKQEFPIYIISLADAAERREHMASQLDPLGLRYEFIEAVDGRSFNLAECDDYNRARRLRWFGRDVSPGDVGCFRSHLRAYRKIVAADCDYAVLFEDDAAVDDRFWPAVVKLISLKPEQDFIRFFGDRKTVNRGGRILHDFGNGAQFVRMPTTPGGTHAILVSRAGAQKMLRYREHHPMTFPIDMTMARDWETGFDTAGVIGEGLAVQNMGLPNYVAGDERFDKTLQISGYRRTLYPIGRFWFRVGEAWGKRSTYWLRAGRDRRARARFEQHAD